MVEITLVQSFCPLVTQTSGELLLNNSLPWSSYGVVRNDTNDGELEASKDRKEAVRPFFFFFCLLHLPTEN